MSYRLSLRFSAPGGARVEHRRFAALEPALAALEDWAREIAGDTRRSTIDLRYRRFEPVQQVAARAQIAGPGRLVARVAGGIDVRGDGSLEAFAGRVRREVVEIADGESAFEALGRVLRERAGGHAQTSPRTSAEP